jgi:hypothetical protein
MAKLRLDLDALVVDSFDTVPAGAGRGTIAANQLGIEEPPASQSNCEACYYTLPATCLSCGEDVCTMASKTECPSCYDSCNGCGPTCACPAEQADPVETGSL